MPRLAFADADLAAGAIADFTLASGSSWPLTRASESFTARALCAITKDSLVSIVKYRVLSSDGGVWGAKPCGGTATDPVDPVDFTECLNVTGGQMPTSIPTSVAGVISKRCD